MSKPTDDQRRDGKSDDRLLDRANGSDLRNKTSPSMSDHFDGVRYFNPGTAGQRRLLAVLRWRLHAKRSHWPSWVDDPDYPPPPETVTPGEVAVTFIGHASFLLRLADAVVLTDPVFSHRCSPVSWAGPKRHRAPGLQLDALPRPEIVLVSHNHYDHMDFPSLRALQARYAPRFVTMVGNAKALHRAGIPTVDELDWWESIMFGNIRITATPTRHFSARTLRDRNRALWGGFMLTAPEGRLLFAGDSGAGDHWRTIRDCLGAPDLALLPIGAYEPRWFMAPVHMDPSEAVQAHQALAARRSIGMHFGTFQLTDEAINAPVEALAVARQAAGITPARFDVMGCGETRLLTLQDMADV